MNEFEPMQKIYSNPQVPGRTRLGLKRERISRFGLILGSITARLKQSVG